VFFTRTRRIVAAKDCAKARRYCSSARWTLPTSAKLNEFIVQHLRESILVVDEHDRVRLINESAAQHLRGDPVAPHTLLGEVSPRLLYLLDTWRRQTQEWQGSNAELGFLQMAAP